MKLAASNTADALILAVAEQKGFFDKAGIKVDTVIFPSGPPMVEAILAKQVDVAMHGTVPYTSVIAKGVPVKVISLMMNYTGYNEIIAPTALNIQSPNQLEGLKFGLPFGSSTHMMMLAFIKIYGLDSTKFNLIDMQYPNIPAAYKNGAIDIAVCLPPYTTQSLQQKPSVVLHDQMTSYFPSSPGPKRLIYNLGIVYTRDDILSQKKDDLIAFVTAWVNAYKWIEASTANFQESISIASKFTSIPVDAMTEALKPNNQVPEVRITPDLPKTLNETANFLLQLGKISQKPDVNKYIYPSILAQVDPSYVTIST